MNKLFVHFQVFQFPFKCIYFHEYCQPRVHEMSSFRTFKISFEELWSFLNFMNFFYEVIDPQVVQLSFKGNMICPENGADLFTLYGFHTRAVDLPRRGSVKPPITPILRKICPIGHLILRWTKL